MCAANHLTDAKNVELSEKMKVMRNHCRWPVGGLGDVVTELKGICTAVAVSMQDLSAGTELRQCPSVGIVSSFGLLNPHGASDFLWPYSTLQWDAVFNGEGCSDDCQAETAKTRLPNFKVGVVAVDHVAAAKAVLFKAFADTPTIEVRTMIEQFGVLRFGKGSCGEQEQQR